jgi:hypothetical protein
MPRLFSLLLLAACVHATVFSAQPAPPLRVVALEPTVLFPKREPLAQLARLVVHNSSGAAVTADVAVAVVGGASIPTQAVTFAPNQNTYDVLIPDIAAPAEVRVEIRATGLAPLVHTQPWQPQRKWKVFIVKSSHEDIGYENFIYKKQHEIANFIDLGQELSSPKSVAGAIEASVHKRTAYHYTMESILFQRNYIEERGERAWRKLVENDVKPGHMSLMGAPSGVHTHWMDYEQLARMAYPARRETRDRFGLDLKTFMIVDNPSLSWSGAQVLANSGFKYVARWGQGWRTGGRNDYAAPRCPRFSGGLARTGTARFSTRGARTTRWASGGARPASTRNS